MHTNQQWMNKEGTEGASEEEGSKRKLGLERENDRT